MPEQPQRAPRLPLHLVLRYRRAGEAAWSESITQNISRSGLLFRAQSDLDPEATVELELRLPAVAGLNPSGASVVARARIVRRAELTGLDGQARIAVGAAFLDYDFARSAA
jgi:hypothetical protein